MNFELIKDIIDLAQQFEEVNKDSNTFSNDIEGFKQWIKSDVQNPPTKSKNWEGKNLGRSPESVINTLFVQLNRYAKSYSKSAIHDSDFSTQDDFIFLISLKAYGAMSKMDLIKLNKQEKPNGIKTINRLLAHNFIDQSTSKTDKRSKIIHITQKGLDALEAQMSNIRKATQVVTGGLNEEEKLQLIYLLQKLDEFHEPIYNKNLSPADLVDVAYNKYVEFNES